MKKTAEVFYKIARILAIVLVPILAVVAGIYLTLGIVHVIREMEYASDFSNFAKYLVWSILAIVALIVTSIQFKRMAEDPKDKAPHIVCIVFGVLSGNPCFIVGAILNIIMICQNEEPQQVEAEKKEEEKTAEEEKAE